MAIEQFFSRPSGSFSAAFNSRHHNQGLPDEARELARLGLKLFPVGLSAKLAGDPDRSIAGATDDVYLLEELSAAALPLAGYRLAIGQSGLSIWRLDGREGRSSFASLAPDLDESLTTLQACRGDAVYAFFRQPAGMRRITTTMELRPGVSVLGDREGFDVPPDGGAAWMNPGAEIEALPYVLRALLASEDPDSPPGRAMPAPRSPRPVPCRSTVYFPQSDKGAPRRGHPVCGQRGRYRISRRR